MTATSASPGSCCWSADWPSPAPPRSRNATTAPGGSCSAILAVGLLSDAFRAGKDLVVIEDELAGTATDADGLADASGDPQLRAPGRG